MKDRIWVAATVVVFGLAILVELGVLDTIVARAADHRDAPLVRLDGATDINDVYAFVSPSNPDNTVLILTVNPMAGVLSPDGFGSDISYELHIDQNFDDRRDSLWSFDFQGKNAKRVEVRQDGKRRGRGRTGREIALKRGGRFMAGTFDDPFFADLQVFDLLACRPNPADDFAGFNVNGMVLEVPTSRLTKSGELGLWATTRRRKRQIDRMGLPITNTLLIPADRKDAFNALKRPDKDDKFERAVREALRALSDLSPQEENFAVNLLLPDILRLQTGFDQRFPNGRRLEDDVIDIELAVVTGALFRGETVTDCVNVNDAPFSSTFPYLGDAHE